MSDSKFKEKQSKMEQKLQEWEVINKSEVTDRQETDGSELIPGDE